MPQAFLWVATLIENVVVAGAEALGASEATAVALGDAAVALTAAAALGVVANSLAPKTPSPEAQRLTFRQAIPPRRRGCGRARMGGPYLLDYATNGVLYRIIGALDCPCSNIDEYWMHQDSVRLVAGVVQSLPNGAYDSADQRVKIWFAYGVGGTPSFTTISGEVGGQWPATACGTGIFMVGCRFQSPKLQYFAHDYPYGADPQFNCAGDIDLFFDWRDESQSVSDQTTWAPSSNAVVVLVNELWRHHDYVWAQDFEPTLDVLTASANICDETMPVLNILAKITQDVAAGDSHVHLKRVDGLVSGTTIYVEGQTFTVSGAPSADGDGGYLVNLSGSIVAGIATGGVASWQSDPDSPVTEKRYTANGIWNADEDESTSVKRLIDAMDGFMCRRAGDNAVIIMAGTYYEPTVVLGADELIDYTWQPYVENAKAVNELVPAFVSPAYNYTTVDTTPWRDETDIDARGVVQSQPFAPELVQSDSQVRRLAKARMARASASIETFKFKISALRALGERFVRLQAGLDQLSDLEDVVLEVVGDYQIVDNGMSVVLTVIKAVTNMYDWDYLTEEGDGPSNAARPFAGPLPEPTITGVTPFTAPLGSSSLGTKLSIDATGPNRSDLTWAWRIKPSAGDTWSDYTNKTQSGGTVTLTTDFVAVGAGLDVEVAYITGNGILSPWSETATITPSDPAFDPAAAGLGALASKDTAATGDIVDGAVTTVKIATGSVTRPTIDTESTPVSMDGTDITVLSDSVTIDHDGTVYASATMKPNFTGGTRSWTANLYINGDNVYTASGTNFVDSLTMSGGLACTAGTIAVSATFNSHSSVNIGSRNLFAIGYQR